MKVSLLSLLRRAGIIFVVCMATAIVAPAQSFTTLFSFDGADGANPARLIEATDGNFYGTTTFGGTGSCFTSPPGCGTVFKITPEGTLTTLHSFHGFASPDGSNPVGLIQSSDGNFYGTTGDGGTVTPAFIFGCGTIFKITPEGTLTTLHRFNGSDGAAPVGLVQATDGNFYGTAGGGGTGPSCNGSCGVVFKITPSGVLTTLHRFNGSDGAGPVGLMQATDGNFYGATAEGGTGPCTLGCGTVFKITPSGMLTTLHRFNGTLTGGASPVARLVQGTDGNLYGTTSGNFSTGGASFGTVFKITPSGTLTTLHSFNGSDAEVPGAGLIQAKDGNFYGTATGLNNDFNSAFEITSAGTLVKLQLFAGPQGSSPGELVQATDGNFYGTNFNGGTNDHGTIFRFAAVPAATLTSGRWFGYQALHQTGAAKTFTLKNSGSALLIISRIAIEGSSSFAISANTCSGPGLAPGQTCNVSVTLTPVVLGNLTGTLTFTDNASSSPQVAALAGVGTEPATLTPASANFGLGAVGTTSTAKTFTLSNFQNVALTRIAISTTGDFAVSATTCTTSLAAQSKCTINVIFKPTATGTRTGKLRVSDSANNSPQTSNLTGVGK